MTQDAFNFDAAVAARDAGLDRACNPMYRRQLLESARKHARRLGASIIDVTADEVFSSMMNYGEEPELLGNASGAIFKGSEWQWMGTRMSERKSRRAGRISVWRLKSA